MNISQNIVATLYSIIKDNLKVKEFTKHIYFSLIICYCMMICFIVGSTDLLVLKEMLHVQLRKRFVWITENALTL